MSLNDQHQKSLQVETLVQAFFRFGRIFGGI